MNALTLDLRIAAAKKIDPATPDATPAAQSSFPMLGKMLRSLACWWRVRREIGRLSSYPDGMLKDIGISRGGIPWAVRYGRRYPARETRREEVR
jgi:uncharacterized protein YjiS (DUF1127 family)